MDKTAITDIKAFEIEQFAATKYPEVKENVHEHLFLSYFSRWIFCWIQLQVG
jgi:hypothetical protein